MRALDIIRLKRDGHVLTRDAIDAFVAGVTDGTWPDYQVSALLMAIFLKGMTIEEATDLTQAMVHSGLALDWSELTTPRGCVAVDKHSTGGVGDKTSLVLAPLAAACGAIVPMMSGRGLGHTGGTLDKLAAIPGFRTDLSLSSMRKALAQTGCVLIRQTADVAPADRKMYALRDATSTVESKPLIASSILSKKITEGIGALVMDVKVGSGGFMEDIADARELARWLVAIAGRSGVRTEAFLTRMDTPLGLRVGNSSEVMESIATLKGEGPKDLEALSVHLAARMLVMSGVATADEAESRIRAALSSGRGLETFAAIITAQGGDARVIDDASLLPMADHESLVAHHAPGLCRPFTPGRSAAPLWCSALGAITWTRRSTTASASMCSHRKAPSSRRAIRFCASSIGTASDSTTLWHDCRRQSRLPMPPQRRCPSFSKQFTRRRRTDDYRHPSGPPGPL